MKVSEDMGYQTSKVFTGFAIAPLAPCIIVLIIAAVQGGGDGGTVAASIVFPISYVVSAVIGFPVYLLLKHLNYDSARAYITSGALAAIVPFLLIVGYPTLMMSGASPASMGLTRFDYYLLGMMAVYGALVAGIFWVIVRPDRRGSESNNDKS
jgi:hypothetical protein